MAGLNQITGGKFQDFEGNVLANGYLMMELSHDEQESVDPGEVIAGHDLRVPLDANGTIAGTVLVWPNDQLNPANSYYTVNAYSRSGVLAWRTPQYQTVPSSPSPFNVGNWIPSNPAPVGAPVGSVLLRNNGINNSSQSVLNLESTDSTVVITDEGDGTINLQAQATSILLENNGTPNSSQTVLNLESTDSSVTITDEGGGSINLQAAKAILLQHNGTDNSSQSALNLESTDSSVTITDEGSGNINLHVSTFGGNSRTTASISQSINAGAVYQGTVSMAYSFMVMQAVVNVPCRIQLYNTQAAANADLNRPPGQPLNSTQQSECICDILLTAATGLTWILAPAAMGFDGQATPTGNIAFNLTNESGTLQTVTVTLTFLPMET